MGGILAQAIPPSIGAAISPLVLMVALAIIGGARPKPRSVAYVIGLSITCIVPLGLGLLGVDLERSHSGRSALGSPPASFISGVVMLLFVVHLLGAFAMIIDLSSLIVLAEVLKVLGHADAPFHPEVVVVAIAAVFTILPAALPVTVAQFGDARASAWVQKMGQWSTRKGKYILALLFLLFLLFLVFGVMDLLKAFGHEAQRVL